MKKEELEAILGGGGNQPDTGAIEDHLHALAFACDLPVLSLGICAIRIEEAGPALHALLVRAADGEMLSEAEKTLLFRGLHILGGARWSQACRPLLRLLRRPQAEVDDLLGDTITESLAKIVAGVFDGDVEALLGAIADRAIEAFIRDALLGAAAFLTWDGRIEGSRMRHQLRQFHAECLADDGDPAWIGWLQAIALLGLRDLAPLVHDARREGRIPPRVLDPGDFEQDLAEAERAPADYERFRRANLGYVDDVLVALEWAGTTRGSTGGKRPEPFPADTPPRLMAPVINPFRHVGRNDPCPCGSGRKAKKCCLDT